MMKKIKMMCTSLNAKTTLIANIDDWVHTYLLQQQINQRILSIFSYLPFDFPEDFFNEKLKKYGLKFVQPE